MSFAACLTRLEAEGVIDSDRAARFREEYDRLNASYARRMGEASAADLASRDALDALEFQALTERRQSMLQIATQRGVLERLTGHVENGGKAGQFAISVMEHHEAVRAGQASVENVRGGLYRLAWSRMDGFLSRYRRDLLGRVRNGNELRDMVRELRGEGSGNASAREMAGAVSDTMEWLRQQFNLAGGNIAKLTNWGLPQSHDALEVGKAGMEAWREFIRPLLDPAQMIDSTTGKAFAGDDALDEALEAAWRNISSEGLDGQVPGAFTAQGKVANRRSDHRFLVFKDADAWLAYNDRFGTGDVFDAVTGHIDSMTRDIAAMQVLGPNPAATVRWLGDMLRQDALPAVQGGKAPKLERAARRGADTLNTMWDYYSGALTAVPPEYRGQARFFQGLRNWNVMSKLGSAFLSAMPSDPVFMGMTAKFNGLPVTGVLADYAKGFNPADASHRAAAEAAGLIFNEMTQRAERMWREGRGVNMFELTRRGADGLLRTSLLTPHTVAAKQSLGLSFMRDWADHAGVAFGALDGPKRQALERYGIDAADWDRLRGVGVFDQDGKGLLRPGDLARRGGDADIATALKFMSLIDSETRFGVPGESLRAQAAVATLNNSVRVQRGTIGGELLHSATQFKTYSVIMVTTHLQRALYGEGGLNGMTYALALPTMLTMTGLLANWMIDIANGRDPSPIDNGLTWARAMVRGGGLGIVGDLISQGFAGDRGSAGPITGFVTGPTIAAVADPLVSLTLGNIGEAASGEKMHLGSEMVRQFRNLTPGSNLWYSRLAFNRLWADQLQAWADPNFRDSYRRLERRAQEQGSAFWWAPGETAPERAPDLPNAFAGPGSVAAE